MQIIVTGPIVEWRGPAPYHFVVLPFDDADRIAEVASAVSYGWGMIPVHCQIGATDWTTSLWPRQETYVIPLKDSVRRSEGLSLGDVVTVELSIRL